MTQNDLIEDYKTLPPEAQKQVSDFIAFLHTRYRIANVDKTKPGTKLADESFVGIWQDRKEMRNSSAWVRETRMTEWG
ncbi:MAG: DUF2281 domain-containing protein [Anaerolineales bacterium]|nr:DUF2281 domain-containing protein [Anaerolineales bacterium]